METAVGEKGVDGGAGAGKLIFRSVFDGFGKDGIAVDVVGDKQVGETGTQREREITSLICIYLAGLLEHSGEEGMDHRLGSFAVGKRAGEGLLAFVDCSVLRCCCRCPL